MAIKKIESIKGLGKLDKLTVQKSLPLFALWQSDLTLSEFKILDMYLSRIDSHHPERRQIVLEKGEVERALGIKKINNQDLRNRLRHLMGNVVEIPDNTIKKGFRLVTLFEEAVAEQEDDELWQVKLECTQKAMKYFFNIEILCNIDDYCDDRNDADDRQNVQFPVITVYLPLADTDQGNEDHSLCKADNYILRCVYSEKVPGKTG